MSITGRIVGDVAVFDVAGDLTRMTITVPTLHDLVRAQLETGRRKFLFNYEKAEFIDSSGIGLIIGAFTSVRNLGGDLRFCCIPQKLRMVMMITGIVPRVITAYPDEAAALASFAAPESR